MRPSINIARTKRRARRAGGTGGQHVRGQHPKGAPTRPRRRQVRKRRYSQLQRSRHAKYVRRVRAAALRSAHLSWVRSGLEPIRRERGKRKSWLRK